MNCPGCGRAVTYIGLAKNPKQDGQVQLYGCETCNKKFITTNPPQAIPNTPPFERAVKLYEEFNMKPADGVQMANISLPDTSTNPLVHLGKISGIIYISDKEGKKGQQYIHDTNPPHPDFFVTADGKTFIIAGGKMVVKDGWLYY
jgi:hypothetical protein